MNLLALFKNWKDINIIWTVLQPFVIKLIQKNVPSSKIKLYENIAKYNQPAIDSLYKLKQKIQNSPNKLDDECFEIALSGLEAYNDYLADEIKKLRS